MAARTPKKGAKKSAKENAVKGTPAPGKKRSAKKKPAPPRKAARAPAAKVSRKVPTPKVAPPSAWVEAAARSRAKVAAAEAAVAEARAEQAALEKQIAEAAKAEADALAPKTKTRKKGPEATPPSPPKAPRAPSSASSSKPAPKPVKAKAEPLTPKPAEGIFSENGKEYAWYWDGRRSQWRKRETYSSRTTRLKSEGYSLSESRGHPRKEKGEVGKKYGTELAVRVVASKGGAGTRDERIALRSEVFKYFGVPEDSPVGRFLGPQVRKADVDEPTNIVKGPSDWHEKRDKYKGMAKLLERLFGVERNETFSLLFSP